MQHKLRSLTELHMYKENIMNGKYPQRICKYCKMKTTFYCVGCSDMENDYLGLWHFQRLLYSASHRNGLLKLIDSLIWVCFFIALNIYHDISSNGFHLSQYLDFFVTVFLF